MESQIELYDRSESVDVLLAGTLSRQWVEFTLPYYSTDHFGHVSSMSGRKAEGLKRMNRTIDSSCLCPMPMTKIIYLLVSLKINPTITAYAPAS